MNKHEKHIPYFLLWSLFPSNHRLSSGCFQNGCRCRRCGWSPPSSGCSRTPVQWRSWRRRASRMAERVSSGRSRPRGGCSWGWSSRSRAGSRHSARRRSRQQRGGRVHRSMSCARCPGGNTTAGNRHYSVHRGWCLCWGEKKIQRVRVRVIFQTSPAKNMERTLDLYVSLYIAVESKSTVLKHEAWNPMKSMALCTIKAKNFLTILKPKCSTSTVQPHSTCI